MNRKAELEISHKATPINNEIIIVEKSDIFKIEEILYFSKTCFICFVKIKQTTGPKNCDIPKISADLDFNKIIKPMPKLKNCPEKLPKKQAVSAQSMFLFFVFI